MMIPDSGLLFWATLYITRAHFTIQTETFFNLIAHLWFTVYDACRYFVGQA